MSLAKLNQRYLSDDSEPPVYTEGTYFGIQFYQYDTDNNSELYIPKDFDFYLEEEDVTANIADLPTEFTAVHELPNYQYLDMGFREHNTDMNKRYRELQFRLNNISQEPLRFQTEFSIDGDIRQPLFTYKVHQNTDPDNTDYGNLFRESTSHCTRYNTTWRR